jgi:uncharacterized iron-regulated membrane protein
MSIFSNSRAIHRALVPFAALPLIITALTGVGFSVLDQRGIHAKWLLRIHRGEFGPLDLEPYYAYVLGLCVVILVISGVLLWWRSQRPRTV